MGSLFDAIELWSANLYEQVRMLAERRGWGTRPYPYLISPAPMRFISFTATTVNLPGGLGGSFTPRCEPSGDRWIIDVRRTDGKVPAGTVGGVWVGKVAGGYGLGGEGGPITDLKLAAILEDLAS